MSEQSKIEWCDATVNFWHGCTKVSAGCANCYAEVYDKRKLLDRDTHFGKGKARLWRVDAARKLALKLDRRAHRDGERLKVFANSLGDWLDAEVPLEWFVGLLDTVRMSPYLDWLLLTKRPENWRKRMDEALTVARASGYEPLSGWIYKWLQGHAPANVWVGTSVEDQRQAVKRIPKLIQIPAVIRFLSCEPLLGRVSFYDVWHMLAEEDWKGFRGYRALHLIDWVICGGESGAAARPMHVDWVRCLMAECDSTATAFFFKQWGNWIHQSQLPPCFVPREGVKIHTWEDGSESVRVSDKSMAVIDGYNHRGFPEVKGEGDA